MAMGFKMSEAVSLAWHALAFLAARPGELVATPAIARACAVSEHHLAKVLQRLARAGLVQSVRGPRGGFQLRPDSGDLSLLDVYETLEGRLDENHCLLGSTPLCRRDPCQLSGVSRALLTQFKTRFAGTRLSDSTRTFRSET